MKVILDENVPGPIRTALGGCEVMTVQELGWAGTGNGELLRRIEGRFDVLLLADKNLRYQQNVTGRRVALIELPTNRWPLLQPLLPRIAEAVRTAQPGSYTRIEFAGQT